MGTARLLVLFALAVSCSGCSMSDAVFNLFGDNYSGGGTTRLEKKAHYESQLEHY